MAEAVANNGEYAFKQKYGLENTEEMLNEWE